MRNFEDEVKIGNWWVNVGAYGPGELAELRQEMWTAAFCEAEQDGDYEEAVEYANSIEKQVEWAHSEYWGN
jgi:hypothetical protein